MKPYLDLNLQDALTDEAEIQLLGEKLSEVEEKIKTAHELKRYLAKKLNDLTSS